MGKNGVILVVKTRILPARSHHAEDHWTVEPNLGNKKIRAETIFYFM